MNRADIEDLYGDDEPNICFAEGFDEAIAGVVWDGERTRVVYDMELILELLMGRSEMSYEEAVEYFDYNIAGSHGRLYAFVFRNIETNNMKDTNMDNRVCLFYIADRLMELAEVKDKDLRKYVVEFREECLRNLGVNAVHDHNN